MTSGGGESDRVALGNVSDGLELGGTVGDEDVTVRRVRDGDGLPRCESGGMQRRVAVADPNAAAARHAGRHRNQLAVRQLVLYVQLFVGGIGSIGVGWDPHLHHAQLFSAGPARRIGLGVANSGSGTHALNEAGVDQPRITLGVSMFQRPFQHPRDDLHVLVLMGVEPFAGKHRVLVVHHQ